MDDAQIHATIAQLVAERHVLPEVVERYEQ
jgi:hypothetical protein